jgi:cysteine-rich repeat protein
MLVYKQNQQWIYLLLSLGSLFLGIACEDLPSTLDEDFAISNDLAGCGDGIVSDLEGCDDGNTLNGDGCSSLCTLELGQENMCGNGVVEGGEECDDGNNSADDTCWECKVVSMGGVEAGIMAGEMAGESIAGTMAGENAGTMAGENAGTMVGGMDTAGTAVAGTTVAGETVAGETAGTMAGEMAGTEEDICGDGITSGSEECDDENNISGDGCSNICEQEAPPVMCMDDAFESNDDFQSATLLGVGTYENLMICNGQDDYYRIVGCRGGVLNIDINSIQTQGNLDIRLLKVDQDGTQRALDSSATQEDTESVTYTFSEDHDVYLHVYGFEQAENPYSITVVLTECNPIEVECNANVDCAVGEACENNICVPIGNPNCVFDDECEGNQICQQGQCVDIVVPECMENWECPIGKVCQNGTCVQDQPDECIADFECNVGEICQEGQCILEPPEECILNSDCNPNEICQNNVCVPNLEDDRFENNDVVTEATPMAAGDYEDLQIIANDEDWYAIDLCEGGTLSVQVNFIDVLGDLDITLYRDSANLQYLRGSSTSSDNESLTYTSNEAGTVYLKIAGFSGDSNQYTLNLTITDCGGVMPECLVDEDCEAGEICDAGVCINNEIVADRFESNDQLSEASSLTAGSYDNLTITTDDDDWYEIVLCQNGTVRVNLTFTDSEGDIDFELVDSTGSVLGASATASDNESIIYTNFLAGERIYVHVYGWLGSTNRYDLSFDITGCDVPECVVDSDCFSNETCNQGTCILAPNACIFDFECAFGEICDVNGLCVPENNVDADRFEENDTLETAENVSAGTYDDLSITANDEDWISIDLCAGGTLNAEVSFLDINGDLDIELYDTNGAEVDSSTLTGDLETLSYTTTEAQRLYVKVFGYSGATNSYSISLELTDCDQASCDFDTDCATNQICTLGFCEFVPNACSSDLECGAEQVCNAQGLCEDNPANNLDRLEENDTLETAEILLPNLHAGLNLHTEDDEDWIGFDLCAGGTVEAELTFTHSNGDIELSLYDENEVSLDSSISSTDNEDVSYTTVESKRLYFRIYGYATNTYDFNFSISGCA